MFPTAKALDVGIMAYGPLSHGLLTGAFSAGGQSVSPRPSQIGDARALSCTERGLAQTMSQAVSFPTSRSGDYWRRLAAASGRRRVG